MGDEPVITVDSAGIKHALWRRCSVSVVRGAVTISDIEKLEIGFEKYMAEHPGKHVTISYVLPNDARPSAEVRERIRVMMDKYEVENVAAAYVIPAEGLTGALQRSVLTSVMMLTRGVYPRKVFKSLEDGCDWCGTFLAQADPEVAREPRRIATVIHALAGTAAKG